MTGAAARHDLVRLSCHWTGATRSARFLARRRGITPSFAQLCAAPRWPVLDAEGQTWLGAVALLLAGRATLAREIDGARLRAYGAIIGDVALEQILACDDDGRDAPPPAALLAAAGEALVRDAALGGNQDAARRLARAEAFLREVGAWPSI